MTGSHKIRSIDKSKKDELLKRRSQPPWPRFAGAEDWDKIRLFLCLGRFTRAATP